MRKIGTFILRVFIVKPFMLLGWMWALIKMSFKFGHDIYMGGLNKNMKISKLFKQGDMN